MTVVASEHERTFDGFHLLFCYRADNMRLDVYNYILQQNKELYNLFHLFPARNPLYKMPIKVLVYIKLIKYFNRKKVLLHLVFNIVIAH